MVLGCVNPPIRQTPASDASNCLFGAHRVINAELGTFVGAEIELKNLHSCLRGLCGEDF
jgi:hypothetical protein